MFKLCRKKRKPEPAASGLSWKQLEQPAVAWPVVEDGASNAGNAELQNGKTKLETAETLNYDAPTFAQTKEQQLYHARVTDSYKLEEVESVQINPPKLATVVPQDKEYSRVSVENDKTETAETYNIQPANIATVECNNDIGEVKYGHEEIPKVVVSEEQIVDANDNHIHPHDEPKKSNDSLNFRPSSVSILSVGTEDARLSSASLGMTRRIALRNDDEDDDVELIEQNISQKDQEIIKKALQANDFMKEAAHKAIDAIPNYMTLKEFAKGDVIMKQGEKGDCMYVNKTGEYKVEINNQTIDKFKKSRLFGELAILYDDNRSATVLATSHGQVWELQRKVFRTIMKQSSTKDRDIRLEFLKKIPVINEASVQKLAKIAEICENRFYPSGTVIIREGQRGDEFFIIKNGSVEISKAGQGKIKTLGTGSYFGERALLYNDDKRKATVTASGYGVDCLKLTRREFNEYLGDFRKFLEKKDEPRIRLAQIPPPDKARFAPYEKIEFKQLERIKLLGEGGFGKVYLVKGPKGKHFALKEVKYKFKDQKQSKTIIENVFRERDIQRACDSIFIVQIYRTFHENTNFYFLLEYCPRAELFTLLRKKRYFADNVAKFTAACVLKGLAYIHSFSFAYLDLKPENIFIDKAGYAKLGDFGNAELLSDGAKSHKFVGTPEYMAPEIIQIAGHGFGADYWAYGVLIYEMLIGRTPFRDREHTAVYAKIQNGLSAKHFPENFNKPAMNLIRRLMHLNPAKRIGCLQKGIDDIYEHDWFKEFKFGRLETKEMKSPLLSYYRR